MGHRQWKDKDVFDFRADSSGVNVVRYLRAGVIATLGKSYNTSSVKLWDTRMSSSGVLGEYKPCLELNQPSIRSSIGEYTSLVVPSLQDQLICGSNQGVVTAWDFRNGATINSSSSYRKRKSRGD